MDPRFRGDDKIHVSLRGQSRYNRFDFDAYVKLPMLIKRIKKLGFSIMELMVTVIILGGIASIAIPKYLNTVEKTRAAEGVEMLKSLLNAQKVYKFETGSYANSPTNLEVDFTNTIIKNFSNTITVSNNTSQLATVTRLNGINSMYTLSISETGGFTCTNQSPYTFCTKIGF